MFRKKLLNPYNLVPLCIVPAVFWSVVLPLESAIQGDLLHDYFYSPAYSILRIALLSATYSICGYCVVSVAYKVLSNRLSKILPPENLSVVGFIYTQFLAIEGKMYINALPFGKTSFIEYLGSALVPTFLVPLSTLNVAIHEDYSLILLLACLAMIVAGYQGRKKYGTTQGMGRSLLLLGLFFLGMALVTSIGMASLISIYGIK